jgi:uncharacterized protein
VSNYSNQLRLNVGFLLPQSVGTSRDFPFDVPKLRFGDDLELSDLSGSARITRIAQGLLVQVKAQADLQAECVRCLTGFSQALSVDFTELYAFNHKSVTESGLIVPEDGHIDLTPLLREYLLLDIPIKPLCSPDCKGLCPVCGENLNEIDCGHTQEEIDPRLSGLKSLLDKQDKN